jgi:hypothetical protein
MKRTGNSAQIARVLTPHVARALRAIYVTDRANRVTPVTTASV